MAEKGHLVKVKAKPNPPPGAPIPILTDSLERLYYDDPSTNIFDGVTPDYVVLTRNVLNFKVEPIDANAANYDLTLELRDEHQTGPVEPGARRKYDHYELKLTIRPENSYPRQFE
jgi:hypothetical protein